MEKVILAVGDNVLPRHCRQARNLIAAEAHAPMLLPVSVDDLMLSDIDLLKLHGDASKPPEDLCDNDFMEFSRMHLQNYGFVASVVFDERSYYYCKKSSVNRYLVKQPTVRYWLVRSDGCAVPV